MPRGRSAPCGVRPPSRRRQGLPDAEAPAQPRPAAERTITGAVALSPPGAPPTGSLLNDRARISCTKRDGGIKKGNSRYKCPQDTILRTKGIPHEGHSPERPSLGQGPVAEKPPPLPQRRGAATLSDYL